MQSNFGADTRPMSIGVKREMPVQDTYPGHTPLNDDKNLRATSPEHKFSNKITRGETL